MRYNKLSENEIREINENVRYWLLEDEEFPGEQQKKIDVLERLIGRTIDRDWKDYRP